MVAESTDGSPEDGGGGDGKRRMDGGTHGMEMGGGDTTGNVGGDEGRGEKVKTEMVREKDARMVDGAACPCGHEDRMGLVCVRCGETCCIACALASTAPTLRDPGDVFDFLAEEQREDLPFQCLFCWEGSGEPPSLAKQLLEAGAQLSTRQEFKVNWLTDFGWDLRDRKGLTTSGQPFRSRTRLKHDSTQLTNTTTNELANTSVMTAVDLGANEDDEEEMFYDTKSDWGEDDKNVGEVEKSIAVHTEEQLIATSSPTCTHKATGTIPKQSTHTTHTNPLPREHPYGVNTSTPKGEKGLATGEGPYRPFKPSFEETKEEVKSKETKDFEALKEIVKRQDEQLKRLTNLLEDKVAQTPVTSSLQGPLIGQASEEFIINLVKAASASRESQSPLSTASTAQTAYPIKAVPIELPKFDGDHAAYESFVQHLEFHIKRQSNMGEIEKFAVLRAHLEGPAFEKVACLSGISESSYRTARELLHDAYGDRYAARDYAITDFNAYGGVLRYDGNEIDAATDRLRILVTRCRETGVPEDYLMTSVRDILRKLPSKIREDLLDLQDESTMGVPLNMDDVLKCMCKHARRALRNERVNPVRGSPRFNGQHFHSQNNEPQKGGGQRTAKTSDEPPVINAPMRRIRRDFVARPCFYCGDQHTEFQCQLSQEKKLKKVKDSKACKNCLSTRHETDGCYRGHCMRCKEQGTLERHHTTLCPNLPKLKENKEEGSHLSVSTGQRQCIQTYFRTKAQNPTKNVSCDVMALVDQGSTDSFVLETTAKSLKLPMLGYRTLHSATCFTEERRTIKVCRVELDLLTTAGDTFRVEALAVENLVPPINIQPIALNSKVQKLIKTEKNVANKPPDKTTKTEVHLLLGNGIYGRIMRPAVGCKALDESQDLVMYDTPFGKILSGTTEGAEEQEGEVEVFRIEVQDKDEIHKTEDPLIAEVRKGWQIENLGISLREAKPNRDRSKATKELLQNARIAPDGRWEIRLPFRPGHHGIHPNWGKAFGRLRSIYHKLTPEQRRTYFKTWGDLIANGYLEPAPKTVPPGTLVHHIPHFPVIKESSLTTKVRPVLDAAAATADGGCLNDLLITGPQVGEKLLDILLRFRVGVHAVISDVKSAFYAIAIAPQDRDAVRVLLPEDPEKEIETNNVKTWRYTRLVMGATCSSWILNSLLSETIQQKIDDPEYKVLHKQDLERIKCNFYADNNIYTVDTIEHAKLLAKESQVIFDGKGFHLREFCATDLAILEELLKEDIHQLEVLKVLGNDWKTKTDTIWLHPNNDYKNENPTRREFLSIFHSVYDPYGIYAPVTIRGRMMERTIIEEHTQWDDKIPSRLLPKWKDFLKDLKGIHEMSVPRNVKTNISEQIRLVAFSDASSEAFAAVVYVWQWNEGSPTSHVMMAKAKLRPKEDHKATIPRLELLGMHCAAQMLSQVKEALKFTEVESMTLFSDSQIALHWAHSNKKLPPYEDNRVNDIMEAGVKDLRFVPTKINPADLPTRGVTTDEMTDLWFHGPEFLKLPFNDWPKRWEEITTDTETFSTMVQDGQPLDPPWAPPELPTGWIAHATSHSPCYSESPPSLPGSHTVHKRRR